MPEVTFNGSEGRLEGRFRKGEAATSAIAIVLHPHPQHGGTMNHKVVHTVFHCFARLGFSVLRFNYRGVGRSQGAYDNGLGEFADAASALDWLQSHYPNAADCWVAGFSFGAWIAMQILMRRPEVHGFISIAPPANHYDFTFLAPCPSSGLIVHGTDDEHVPKEDVDKLAARLEAQRGIGIQYTCIEGADHFFRGKLDSLTDVIEAHLKANATLG